MAFRGAATTGGLLVFGTESIAVPVFRWFPFTKGMLDGDGVSPEDPIPSRPGPILLLFRDAIVGTLEVEDVLLSITGFPFPPLAGVLLRRPQVSVQSISLPNPKADKWDSI